MTLEQFLGEDSAGGYGSEKPSDETESPYGSENDNEEIDYGSEMGMSATETESDEDYDDEDDSDTGSSGTGSSNDGEDREYTGDMFGKNKPVKFSAGTSKAIGNLNKDLNVFEYVCFSIWRNGREDLRYSRLKDTVIPIAPVKTETRFRTSHTAKSVYYLGEETVEGKEETKLVLVVISLCDLQYKTYDLTNTGERLENL